MKVIDTKFKGLKIIQQKKHKDRRGNLRETFIKKIIKWDELIFDYTTTSKKNVLRGFHFQSKFKQVKFVSVLKGKILDCVIDLRKKSKTFGKSFRIVLSENNCKSLYIPKGFAHGFVVLSENAEIVYKTTDYYAPDYERCILWNDPKLNIDWGLMGIKPTLSNKDKKGDLIHNSEIFD